MLATWAVLVSPRRTDKSEVGVRSHWEARNEHSAEEGHQARGCVRREMERLHDVLVTPQAKPSRQHLKWICEGKTTDAGRTRPERYAACGPLTGSGTRSDRLQSDKHRPDESDYPQAESRRPQKVVSNRHLWHYGRRNRSPSRRRVIQMTATRVALETGQVEGVAEVGAP